jgi:hypothetical protein
MRRGRAEKQHGTAGARELVGAAYAGEAAGAWEVFDQNRPCAPTPWSLRAHEGAGESASRAIGGAVATERDDEVER